MNVIDLLNNKKEFTSTEADVVAYILAHQTEIPNMNIGDLASATFSSNGTIIRLCRKLGYDGFKEFKIDLAKALEKNYIDPKTVDYFQPYLSHEDPGSIMGKVLQIQKNALDATYSGISSDKLNQAAGMISKARRIYMYGQGETLNSLRGFSLLLKKLGIFSLVLDANNDDDLLLNESNENDVFIVASYQGVIYNMPYLTNIANQHRCKIIAISSQHMKPCDLMIQLPNDDGGRRETDGIFAQSCIRYVFNCLYSIILSENMAKLSKKRNE